MTTVQPLNDHSHMHTHIVVVQTFKRLIWRLLILEEKGLSPGLHLCTAFTLQMTPSAVPANTAPQPQDWAKRVSVSHAQAVHCLRVLDTWFLWFPFSLADAFFFLLIPPFFSSHSLQNPILSTLLETLFQGSNTCSGIISLTNMMLVITSKKSISLGNV